MRYLILAAVVAAPSIAGAQSFDVAKIDSIVNAEMAGQKVPGLAVGIVRGNYTLLAKGYGLANVEHRVPVTTETVFQSGSVGKQFTSAAIMLLVEDGKLSLSDPITKFFPDAPASWNDVTVQHLLTHTSGIPDYTTESMDYRKDYTEDQLAKMAYALKLEFPAGSRWNYSNTGYALLGFIARKAGGRFYGDILADRVFKPLGMKSARVINEADIVPNRAAGYRLVGGALRNQEWVSPQLNTTADGSLYLSLNDMLAWERGLRAGTLLKPETWKQVYSQVRLSSGNPYPYGFGWSIDSVGGQLRISHGGAWQGFRTHIDRYRGDDVTIIVLANLAQANPGTIAARIAEAINPALARPAPKPIADTQPAHTDKFRRVVEAAAQGALQPSDFAYVRAGFFPGATNHFGSLLKSAGALQKVLLLERRTLGDDVISTYEAHFQNGVFIGTLGVAPDGRLSAFSLRPKQ